MTLLFLENYNKLKNAIRRWKFKKTYLDCCTSEFTRQLYFFLKKNKPILLGALFKPDILCKWKKIRKKSQEKKLVSFPFKEKHIRISATSQSEIHVSELPPAIYNYSQLPLKENASGPRFHSHLSKIACFPCRNFKFCAKNQKIILT